MWTCGACKAQGRSSENFRHKESCFATDGSRLFGSGSPPNVASAAAPGYEERRTRSMERTAAAMERQAEAIQHAATAIADFAMALKKYDSVLNLIAAEMGAELKKRANKPQWPTRP